MGDVLSTVEAGSEFQITNVPDEEVRAQLLRLGLLDGDVECRRRIPNGPVVVRRGGTQFAIGASLSDRIRVGYEE